MATRLLPHMASPLARHPCCSPSAARSAQWLAVPAGGDAFLSICMWEMGYAPTTPGDAFHQPELRGFDNFNEDRMGLVDTLNRAVEGTCSQRWCHVGAGLIIRAAQLPLTPVKGRVSGLGAMQVLACTSGLHGLPQTCWTGLQRGDAAALVQCAPNVPCNPEVVLRLPRK